MVQYPAEAGYDVQVRGPIVMRSITFFILLACIAAGPTTAPTTLPSAKEMDALIGQLGHDDFKIREDASQKLFKLGKPAVPALKQALASDDPEVQSRAQMLIKRIETRPVPGGPVSRDEQVIAQSIRISNDGAAKVVDVQEQRRKISIREDLAGIKSPSPPAKMARTSVKPTSPADAADLKSQSADAFELYDRWAGSQAAMNPLVRGADNLVIRGPVFIGGFQPIPIPPIPSTSCAARVEQAMDKQKIADEDRKKVADLLDQVQQGRPTRIAVGDDRAAPGRIFQSQRSSSRETRSPQAPRSRRNLPPSKWRLGIQVAPVDEKLVVGDVAPGSRGEKIGLKAGDAIEKINDKPVKDIDELRDALSKTKDPLIITGQRAGEPLKLEEKKP